MRKRKIVHTMLLATFLGLSVGEIAKAENQPTQQATTSFPRYVDQLPSQEEVDRRSEIAASSLKKIVEWKAEYTEKFGITEDEWEKLETLRKYGLALRVLDRNSESEELKTFQSLAGSWDGTVWAMRAMTAISGNVKNPNNTSDKVMEKVIAHSKMSNNTNKIQGLDCRDPPNL